MPGSYVIDQAATFEQCFAMSASPRLKFGSTTGEQDTTRDGVLKWTVQAAVTIRSDRPEMPAQSDLINVSIAQAAYPLEGFGPGTPVAFEGLRVGTTPPEAGDNGRIRGGKLWFTCTGVRPAVPAAHRPAKQEG
jgi:hypothetical protein